MTGRPPLDRSVHVPKPDHGHPAPTLPALLFALDADRRFRTVNDAITNWFGLPRDRVPGLTVRAIVGERAWPTMAPTLDRVYAGESVSEEVLVPFRPDGPQWVHVVLTPERDAGGSVCGAIGFVADVTPLRRAEDRHRQFVEQAPAALAMFDRGMRYLAVSRRWLEINGLVGRDVVGQSHYHLFPETPESWRDGHRRAMAGEVVRSDEEPITRPDGRVQWLSREIRPWHESDGTVGGIVISTEDVTEQKRVREHLRASEARLHTIVDNEPDCIKLLAADGSLLEMNPAGLQMIEADSLQQVRNRCIYPLIAPAYRQAFQTLNDRVFAGQTGSLEFEIVGLRGGRRWLETYATPLRDETGTIAAQLGVTRDVTERKKAERYDQFRRDILEQIATGRPLATTLTSIVAFVEQEAPGALGSILLVDAGGKLRHGAAPRLPDFYTRAIDGVAIGPAVGSCGAAAFNRARTICSDIQTHPNWAAFKDLAEQAGLRSCWSEPVLSAAGDILGTFAVYRAEPAEPTPAETDAVGISTHLVSIAIERARTEETLREKERHKDLLLNTTSDSIWEWNLTTGRVERSIGFETTFGYPASEIEPTFQWWLDRVHPDEQARLWDDIQASMAAGRGEFVSEYRFRHKNGTYRDISEHVCLLRSETGKVIFGLGAMTDVTDRKRAEDRILASQHMLETVLNNIPQGVFWKDRESRYLGCNAVVARAFGMSSPAEILGRTDFDLPVIPADRAVQFHHVDKEVMETGRAVLGSVDRTVLADGQSAWLESNKVPLRDAGGRIVGVLVTWQDVTERRKLEEQLRHAQKMEAVGQLAGGVAHDFNNLLTVINGYADLLLSQRPADDPDRVHLEQIRLAGDRAASLTGQLLAFSRKQVIQPRVLDLNAVVADAEKMLRRVLGEDVALTVRYAPTPVRVKADPGQLGQVLLNLTVNARDVMPRGGDLTIETGHAVLDGSTFGVRPGRYARLTVRDTGIGMSPEVQSRIFEPFFTTKEPGKGTGLGLAVIHGIVRQAEGHIEVESEPGLGATFTVYLPEVEGAASPTAAGDDPTARPGRETVLLVEDEDAVRNLSQFILERYGYVVLVAEDGRDALRIVAAHSEPIDLVVTDVVMPGLGGPQLYEALQTRYPGLKVLFLSGYTHDAVLRHGIPEAETAFLQKPFGPVALARKVREVLDAPV